MITPEARDLFLQVFCRTLDNSDDGPVLTMGRTNWGRIWLECCRVANDIAVAQKLADEATEIAERTPTQVWPP